MKRFACVAIILLLILGTIGCAKKTKYINANDVTESTLLARANGSLQVASVEQFDKNYYNLNELNEFIGKAVDAYNDKAKAKNIKVDKINEKTIQNKKSVVMLLSYAGMKDYSTFNGVLAAYFHGGTKDVTFELPDKLVNASDKSLTSTADVIKNSDYRVLVVKEPLHIVVDGKIKFYSDNAKAIDSNEIGSAADALTVVVYKP